MDIESDESERWEDFFGSSTDLSPSLIGYYDNLSNKFISTTNSDYNNKSKSPTPNDLKPSSPNKICNIGLLSPTVKRMIFQSGSMKDEQQTKQKSSTPWQDGGSIHSVSNSKFYVNTSYKCSTPVKSSSSTAGKKINLPLSKLTHQLSLSNNDLLDVDNESAIEFKNKLDDCIEVTENNHSFLFDHVNLSRTGSSVLETSFDIDSTDTNNNTSNNDPPNTNSLLSNNSFLKKQIPSSLNVTQSDTEDDDDDERYHDCNDASNYYVNIPEHLRKSLIVEAKNSSLHEKYEAGGIVSAAIPRDSENNNNNNNNSSNNSINNNNNRVSSKSNISVDNSKSKALHITESNPSRSNSSEYINNNNNNNNNNMNKSADNKSYNSTSNNNNHSNIINNNLLKAKSSDISDLQTKHRPLSATSITSTTSTSSSSSSENQLASKHAVSYLASVESLADHSECELVVTNSNLTVTEKLVLEIVETEKSYVEDLRQIIHGYLEDWKERACLKEEELRILFSNITEIYDFSIVLLKELINSETDPNEIANCFIEQKDKFDVYTTYCTSYLEAISLLTSLAKASHTNALLVSTQKHLKHRLGLGSYLLKPVQRILKYHLLLENLRKHNDTENIRKAHELMREVANHIDQVKKSLEQQSRVKELSGILDGWLGPELTVLGELRHEGILMESNKPRIVLLFATMLIITKRKEDGRLQCKTYIHHKNLMLIEHIPGEPTSFNVIPFSEPRNLIKLTAKNRDSKRLWAQLIKQVMLEHFDIPNRAKELVFKLGDEEERTSDKNTWKWGHSSTPEYLERRNQYRRSEMRYRSKKARKNLVQSTKSLDDSFIKSKSTSTQSLVNSNNDLSLIGSSISSNINSIHMDEHNHHNHHQGDCNCHTVKTQLNNTLKSSRSKSETRVPLNFNKIHTLNRSNASTPPQSVLPTDSTDDLYEVKMYNKKNIPKRIEKIKKSRSKSLKENSKFYMELKITESSDNIPSEVNNEIEEDGRHDKNTYNEEQNGFQVDDSVNKNDTQIITELLKENKSFDRLLSATSQVKKSHKTKKLNENSNEKNNQTNANSDRNNSSCSSSSGNISTTPVVDNRNNDLVKKQAEFILKLNEIEMNLNSRKPEPIYESLKRNVHVPYKYCPSPNLQRSKSQPHPNTQAIKVKKVERPDSDYVTLDYNAVIHYNQNLTSNTSISAPIPSTVNISSVDIMKLRNSDSNINYTNNGKSSKLNERRISDGNELLRQSAIYKQGSENLGSRIAHLDYADPKTLLPSVQSQCNILINKNLLKSNQERDSVVSLTSSNDSVNNNNNNNNGIGNGSDHQSNRSLTSMQQQQNDSYYEDKIEELLENSNNIRDSAIYSDDNNEKKFHVFKSKSLTTGNHLNIPPPLPAKPNKLPSKYDRSMSEGGALKKNSNTEINNCSNINNNDNDNHHPHQGGGADKNKSSWVLQQIKNFNSGK